jgi:hypothetical protein
MFKHGIFYIKDVILDGGFGVNIIMEKLKMQLDLSKLKPAFYNLRVADQTIAKPFSLIKDLKILCSWNSLCDNFYCDIKYCVKLYVLYVVRLSLVKGC